MKVADLEVGKLYAGKNGRTVMVVATGFTPQRSQGKYGPLRMEAVEKGGTHVAVAQMLHNADESKVQWIADYVPAFQIEAYGTGTPGVDWVERGLTFEEFRARDAKMMADRLAASQKAAERRVRTEAVIQLAHELGYTGVRDSFTSGITIRLEDLERLLGVEAVEA